MRVGVLALQGDFAEHIQVLRRLGVEAVEVRKPSDLERVDALIIPGGESTTIGRLLTISGLRPEITGWALEGMPIWGTCAGMILLGKEADRLLEPPLGLIDIKVERNAFGRQVDSFEVDLEIPKLGDRPVRAIFIRAPVVREVGPGVEVLARLPDGTPVAVQQGKLLGTAFHPELTDDTRFHEYFLSLARN